VCAVSGEGHAQAASVNRERRCVAVAHQGWTTTTASRSMLRGRPRSLW
jgi:hypothetical protein